MGFENRKRKTYYYRKRRVGKRVTSEYAGGGAIALLLAKLDAADLAQRVHEQEQQKIERAKISAVEDLAADFYELANLLLRAALLTRDCHTHKGQWRRKRANRHDSKPAGKRRNPNRRRAD